MTYLVRSISIKYFFMTSRPCLLKMVFNVPGARSSPGFHRQGHSLLEFWSIPGIFLRGPKESGQETDDPDRYESEEAREDIPHPRNTRAILRMQIGLDGIVERKNDDQENSTAEPRKIVVQERLRFGDTIRRQPILLIRKVHQLRRQRSDNTRNAKSDHGGKNAYANKYRKEGWFCLPAICHSTRIKMRGYHIGQLRIVSREMKGRLSRQHCK